MTINSLRAEASGHSAVASGAAAELDPHPPLPARDAVATSPAKPRTHRLVIGDENRLIADALELALTSRGYDVLATATTRGTLLRAVLAHRPDVCLLDPELLDGCAIDLIDHVHARVSEVKVLILSADTSPRMVAAAIEAGAAGCLSKNQGIDALAQAVERVARGEFTIDPVLAQQTLRHLRDHRNDRDQPLRWLTRREREVLRRLTEGDGTREIARVLGVSTNTARTHVQNVLDKLGVHSRLEAVALAIRAGVDSDVGRVAPYLSADQKQRGRQK